MSNSQISPPGFGKEISTEEPAAQPATASPSRGEPPYYHMRDEIDQLTGQLRIAEQKLALYEDEIKKIVNACVVYENAIRNAEARLVAVERRELNFGMAFQALGLAVQGKGSDPRSEKIVGMAESFLEFLQKHAPQPANMAQGQLGNAADVGGGDESKAQAALLPPIEPTKH